MKRKKRKETVKEGSIRGNKKREGKAQQQYLKEKGILDFGGE